jgi:hypothetical protein
VTTLFRAAFGSTDSYAISYAYIFHYVFLLRCFFIANK